MLTLSLDARDRAILYHLDRDARLSISAIAKKIKLSKEVVNYRIKNLLKLGVIQNFSAIVNNAKLGYGLYRLFIQLKNVDVEKEKDLVGSLEALPSVAAVKLLEERYDLEVLVWAKSVFDFKGIYDQITESHREHFQKVLVTLVTNSAQFIHNYLYQTADYAVRSIGGKCPQAQLDAIDLQILELVSQDARIPLLNIAKSSGVSPNTIKHRIKKMVKDGVIVGFRARIDPDVLGYQPYRIFVQFAKGDTQDKNKLAEYLKVHKNVTSLTEGIGRGDLDFEIQVKNGNELHRHLQDLRSSFGKSLQECRATLIRKEHCLNYFPKAIAANYSLQ